jgi:hypothetical protein
MQEHDASLKFDTSKLTEQLEELAGLLKSRFPEGIPHEIIRDLSSLSHAGEGCGRCARC